MNELMKYHGRINKNSRLRPIPVLGIGIRPILLVSVCIGIADIEADTPLIPSTAVIAL